MSDLNQGASIEADPEFLRILANVQHEPNVRLDAEDYVLIDFIDNLARRTPAATTGELPPLPDADDIKGPHGYVEVYFTHTVLDIQREAFELGQRAAIEADRAQRQAAHTAEMAQWARDNGLNVPPQWEVAPASAQPAELTNAEFLAKRLGRVAKLAGVPMPDGTYEQIAEVAGTILGQIAYALERGAQPDQRDSAADTPLHLRLMYRNAVAILKPATTHVSQLHPRQHSQRRMSRTTAGKSWMMISDFSSGAWSMLCSRTASMNTAAAAIKWTGPRCKTGGMRTAPITAQMNRKAVPSDSHYICIRADHHRAMRGGWCHCYWNAP